MLKRLARKKSQKVRKYFRPPKGLVKEWPEVFEDLYINTMPIAYVDTMILEFSDGRIWEIDIKSQVADTDPNQIARKLLETLKEYKDTIKKLDFKINIDLLKADIKNRTDTIL